MNKKIRPIGFAVGYLILTSPVWILQLILLMGMVNGAREGLENYPGKPEFVRANTRINTYNGRDVGFGNSSTAISMATDYSMTMQASLITIFPNSIDFDPSPIARPVTYCQLTPTTVILLCQVPALNAYQNEARENLCRLAWKAAQTIAQERGLDSKMTLVVGLRTFASYKTVLEGHVAGDPTQKITGFDEEQNIYPYFATNRKDN